MNDTTEKWVNGVTAKAQQLNQVPLEKARLETVKRMIQELKKPEPKETKK